MRTRCLVFLLSLEGDLVDGVPERVLYTEAILAGIGLWFWEQVVRLDRGLRARGIDAIQILIIPDAKISNFMRGTAGKIYQGRVFTSV